MLCWIFTHFNPAPTCLSIGGGRGHAWVLGRCGLPGILTVKLKINVRTTGRTNWFHNNKRWIETDVKSMDVQSTQSIKYKRLLMLTCVNKFLCFNATEKSTFKVKEFSTFTSLWSYVKEENIASKVVLNDFVKTPLQQWVIRHVNASLGLK